jgi:Phage integrase, N-terminal SAM-like domain
MITFDATTRPRLKHHGRRTVVQQERYQRPQVQDLGTKWKVQYWDYTHNPRKRRSKCWAKSVVPGERQAQRKADEFMERVNATNNQPHLFTSREETVRDVYTKCRDLLWVHRKNSTTKSYEEHFKAYLLPAFGDVPIRKLRNAELQAYFNSVRVSPKYVELIHATLRAALNHAIRWGMLDKNPAVGVRLPRQKPVKPPVLLPLLAIRRVRC